MLSFITIQEVKDDLGAWCKWMRKSRKLTQKELAKELALSHLTISKLENGENPTIETLLKVLQYFNEMESFDQFIKNRTELVNTNESMYK